MTNWQPSHTKMETKSQQNGNIVATTGLMEFLFIGCYLFVILPQVDFGVENHKQEDGYDPMDYEVHVCQVHLKEDQVCEAQLTESCMLGTVHLKEDHV